MKWVIQELEHKLRHKERMIGSTAPTYWFDNGSTQEGWDNVERKECDELKTAIKILKKSDV